jgi:hypothetical protein
MGGGRRAVLLPAKSAAILLLGGPVARHFPIADFFVALSCAIAGGFRHSARRNGLTHISAILFAQACI